MSQDALTTDQVLAKHTRLRSLTAVSGRFWRPGTGCATAKVSSQIASSSFIPYSRRRRFRAPLRKLDFYDGSAVYRDPRRKLEVRLDQSAMPIIWDATWNQWKHLLGTKVELQATCIETDKIPGLLCGG